MNQKRTPTLAPPPKPCPFLLGKLPLSAPLPDHPLHLTPCSHPLSASPYDLPLCLHQCPSYLLYHFKNSPKILHGLLGGSVVKNPPANAGDVT